MSEASRAAAEVLAGEPGPAARRWLGPVIVIAALLFVVNTLLVVSGITRSMFDVPVERAVQSLPWKEQAMAKRGRYPQDLRERPVRMVKEHRSEDCLDFSVPAPSR